MSDFDVIEVEIAAPHRVRVLAINRTEANAEAIVEIAVRRRGVEKHFYKAVRAGEYQSGDTLL